MLRMHLRKRTQNHRKNMWSIFPPKRVWRPQYLKGKEPVLGERKRKEKKKRKVDKRGKQLQLNSFESLISVHSIYILHVRGGRGIFTYAFI